MKKILFLLLTIIFVFPQIAISQENEEADSKTAEEKIDEIKERVTSKVAELDLVEKRGIVGVVESVNESQIRLNDLNDKTRIIEIDEITKYTSNNTTGFSFEDIEPGTKLSVIGLYNKDSEKLLARFINEISIPVFISGVISEKDEDDFTVTISTEEEQDYLVDIENITRTFSLENEDLESSGFSELDLLQNSVVIGFNDVDDENRISATRVIIFPNIPKNPNIDVDVPEPSVDEEQVSPTSASSANE